MIPVKLRLRNFMSYGENVPELDFSEFHVACLTGKNGHGKSALLDAITWALWGQARKTTGAITPDDGLLRIGTTEMEVEFVFDLEGSRFRVIRKYARTGRSGKRSLEFQFFDSQEGAFRPLTEGGLRVTQHKINDVLRMDYDTFINSAFILQGRADEFTQKSPGERKAILASILGLDRYDELSKLARDKAQQASKQEAVLGDRLSRYQAEIANEEQYSSMLQGVERQLQTVKQDINRYRQQIEKQQALLNDLKAKQVVLEHLTQQEKELRRRIADILNRIDKLRTTSQQCQQLLAKENEIEESGRLYAKLGEELRIWEEKAESYHSLERECLKLQSKFTQQRQALTTELDRQQYNITSLQGEQQRLGEIIAREKEITKAYQRLTVVRSSLQELRSKRKQFELLKLEQQRLGEYIRRVESELRSLLAARRDELQRKQQLVTGKNKLQAELDVLKQQLQALEESEKLLEQLQEHGQRCKSELAGLEQMIANQKQRLEEEREKLSLLDSGAGSAAECPLCGQELREVKRSELQYQLQNQCRSLINAINSTNARRQKLEEQLAQLRQQYRDLRSLVAAKDHLARRSGEISMRLAEVVRVENECRQLEQAIAALEQKLTAREFAQEQQHYLQVLEKKLADLNFEPALLEQLETESDQLHSWEVKYSELEQAKCRLKVVNRELELAQQKALEAEQELAKLESGGLNTRIRQLSCSMIALQYDPQQHKQVKLAWEQLKDIPVKLERLQQARSELKQCEQEILHLEQQQSELCGTLETLNGQISEIEAQLDSLDQISATLAELETALGLLLQTQEELIAEQAAYQSRLDSCRELRSQMQQARRELRQVSRERALYSHLSEAFGKNGIQALIIENAIPELEATANDMLARLTDNTTHIAIESQRERKSGGTIETLDIKISDALGTRAYELYSGGEAFRVNFALRVALSKMLARRAGTKLRTLVIDEGFGTQDEEGLVLLVESIQSISDEFDKIMVVTHLDRLKSAFPVHIAVTKESDTGSTFEVIHY